MVLVLAPPALIAFLAMLVIVLSFLAVSDFVLSHFFFFNDTATTEIYPLSLHDALPISRLSAGDAGGAPDLLPELCQPHLRLRSRRDQPQLDPRLRRDDLLRPRRLRRHRRLRLQYPAVGRGRKRVDRLAGGDRGFRPRLARDRRGVAAHARRVLHHDHARLRADDVLPGELDEGLRRRRGPEPARARLGGARRRPGQRRRVLLRRARRAGSRPLWLASARPVSPPSRGPRHPRQRTGRRGDRLPGIPPQARVLRHRPCPGRPCRRGPCEPRQGPPPERAAPDALRPAPGGGGPRG